MAESAAFDCLCEFLESETSLDRLESRGTVRIALKKAGLTPRDVDSKQLVLVIDKLLKEELDTRGIDESAQVCKRAKIAMESVKAEARANSPTSVFERMVGGD
jgi:hypothetical protein